MHLSSTKLESINLIEPVIILGPDVKTYIIIICHGTHAGCDGVHAGAPGAARTWGSSPSPQCYLPSASGLKARSEGRPLRDGRDWFGSQDVVISSDSPQTHVHKAIRGHDSASRLVAFCGF